MEFCLIIYGMRNWSRGNGLIEAFTFLAILAGTVAGGALVLLDAGPAIVSAAGDRRVTDRVGGGVRDSRGAGGRCFIAHWMEHHSRNDRGDAAGQGQPAGVAVDPWG